MTTEDTKRIYEGLFLFPQSATANLQDALDHLNELLTRADAEVISLCKWDERRLAYEIKGNKRGLYFLAYLRVAPSKLAGFERDCNLSEHLLRAMMTRAETVPEEAIAAAEGRERLADEIRLRGAQAGGEEERGAAAPPAPAPVEAAAGALSDQATEAS